VYYAVLPALSGLGATAALRALINLINPVLHILYALSAVLIPTLVRHRDRSGTAGMTRTMKTLLAHFVFWGYVAASLSTVCFGLPLSRMLGVAGAAAGMLISTSVTAISLAWLYHRRVHDMSY
jgi:O-antigen/teichoic acid export membrane protein